MVSKGILPLFMAVLLLSGTAQAQNPPVTTTPTTTTSTSSTSASTSLADPVCDPNVFQLMRQKAWMEAQRENVINQSKILKPDSTFALTCFDQQVGLVLGKLGVSEAGVGTANFEEAIQKTSGLVYDAFIGYPGNDGPLLTPSGNGEAQTAYENYSSTPAAGTTIDCGNMNKVWTNSQCSNMAGTDLASLNEMNVNPDSRAYPTSCSAANADTSGATGADKYTYAGTLEGIYGTDDKPGPSATLTNFSPVDLHLCETLPYSMLEAANCTVTCHATLTGLLVNGKKEVSCTNPGCHAQAGSGDTMECVKNK